MGKGVESFLFALGNNTCTKKQQDFFFIISEKKTFFYRDYEISLEMVGIRGGGRRVGLNKYHTYIHDIGINI